MDISLCFDHNILLCDYNYSIAIGKSIYCIKLMVSLLSSASYLGRFPTHSRPIVVLKLFFKTVLESGAPLSNSGLEEAL